MLARRLSSFTVSSLVAAAAAAAFCVGRLSVLPPPAPGNPLVDQKLQPAPTPVAVMASETSGVSSARKTEYPDARWAELSARPATPAGESELAVWIEKLAEQDPRRAIAFAAGQGNLRLRASLLRAALKGWGRTQPEAAATWVRTETVMDHAQAVNALLQGAVQDPDRAEILTRTWIKDDSGRAMEYGNDLISALAESGQFARAADFAADSTTKCHVSWMLVAYSRWAEYQPQAAAAAAMQITDPDLRETALNAVIVGWSPTDPKGLVEFTQNNLPSAQQNTALSSAIGFWADSDPLGAANWINQNNPGEASDPGVAKIALSPQLARNPEIAVGWAESIANADLRLEALGSVLKQWTATDPAAAKSFIEYSPVLASEDRSAFRAHVEEPPAP
jgi:hypothetical protein